MIADHIWLCPKCSSTRLAVSIGLWGTLTQHDGEFSTEACGDHEWMGQMRCDGCGFSSKEEDFRVPPFATAADKIRFELSIDTTDWLTSGMTDFMSWLADQHPNSPGMTGEDLLRLATDGMTDDQINALWARYVLESSGD